MDNALAELIRISNKLGKDEQINRTGSTSAKTDDNKSMYILDSTALKDISEHEGWQQVQIESLHSNCDCSCPSVETQLHAILDKFVIQLNTQVVGAFVNSKNGQKKIEKIFKNEKYPLLWVPYANPLHMLTKKLTILVAKYKEQHNRLPQIIFLDKQGLIITANSANAALRLTDRVIKTCAENTAPVRAGKLQQLDADTISDTKLAIRKALFDTTGDWNMVGYFYNETVAAFLKNKDAAKLLASTALTPDELVCANGSPLWIDKINAASIANKIAKKIEKEGKAPASFVVSGVGLFTAGPMEYIPVIAEESTSSLFVRMQAAKMGGVNALNKRECDFINEWESEAMGHCESCAELHEKIAVVTGAGSGLGRNIAIGLAKAGAAVAIADIDQNAASETAEIISSQVPGACTTIVRCNVTDKDSVAAGFAEIVNHFGGLDILVNAAGVAPAYSLTDLPVDKWRFALEVNLTGYFLMAQAAAKIMIKQGMGGSVINISSKSGLDASKNNTAYNATKAGELHMARGWAIELGENNIRVNSVCPGNVFEGSKIWNPEYIKVCAKKYGIKPDEVIPYYVSKTILKKEIKGQDIADAVVFLGSEKSRMITGQTLVVDAGQVMVR